MDWGATVINGLLAATGPTAIAYAISAVGLNLQFGYTGLLNFGHVAFMMVGAYGTAISFELFGSLWLGIGVGILAAVCLGLILGLPTLRLRADYLAITTIAAAEVLRLLIRSRLAAPITGGVLGIQGFAGEFHRLNPFPPAAVFRLGPFAVPGRRLYVMIVGWALAILLYFLVRRLIHSPWGRFIRAIREDEDATRSLGKNVFGGKLQALALGGALAGIAGIFTAVEQQNVTPDAFLPVVTFTLYVIVILGGAGTVWGPLVGTVVFQFLFFFLDTLMRTAHQSIPWLNQHFSPAFAGQVRFVFVGIGLMLLLSFRPQGILGRRDEQSVVA